MKLRTCLIILALPWVALSPACYVASGGDTGCGALALCVTVPAAFAVWRLTVKENK